MRGGNGTAGTATLLALADQRLPSGGHTHSGGVEQAVTDGLVRDEQGLRAFLDRRLRTSGAVAAGLAAAAVNAGRADLPGLDAAADSRMPSPAQREASRAQGRGLLRLSRSAWAAPHPGLDWADLGARPHHPLVLGCAARAAGLEPPQAALVAAYLSMTGPATAAQRLLGLDPVSVAVVTLDLGPVVEAVATAAAAAAGATTASSGESPDRLPERPLDRLPDLGDPLLDLLAERHAARGDRLFAS